MLNFASPKGRFSFSLNNHIGHLNCVNLLNLVWRSFGICPSLGVVL